VGFPEDLHASQYQHLLLDAKQGNATTEPKFTTYLYRVYVRADRPVESAIEKQRAKANRRVDFEEMQKQWQEIGRKAEEYALR
jgi:hypothetical protein